MRESKDPSYFVVRSGTHSPYTHIRLISFLTHASYLRAFEHTHLNQIVKRRPEIHRNYQSAVSVRTHSTTKEKRPLGRRFSLFTRSTLLCRRRPQSHTSSPPQPLGRNHGPHRVQFSQVAGRTALREFYSSDRVARGCASH